MSNYPVSGSWADDAQVKRCAELWSQGLSAAQVREKLNREFKTSYSRNAIIGKMHRMGLSGPNSPVRAVAAKPARPARRKVVLPSYGGPTQATPTENKVASAMANAAVRAAARAAPPPDDQPGLRTILTVRNYECRWPIGDPQNPDFTLCGARCVGIYCDGHTRIAYAPHPTRDRVDARLGIKPGKVAA